MMKNTQRVMFQCWLTGVLLVISLMVQAGGSSDVNHLGSLVQAEGSLDNAEGSLAQAEGSLRKAEGSLNNAEGSLVKAEGSLAQAEGSLKILASIKPLQLIAQAITEGVVDTDVLLAPGSTPHDYALKPSDLGRINEANLIVWLGAPWESYLAKPMRQRTGLDLEVVRLAQARSGHAPETDTQGHAGHVDAQGDPHVWFGPLEALKIAEQLMLLLVEKDAGHAAVYRANFAQFKQRVSAADERIRKTLSNPGSRRYLVYHDAYSYFERQYGIAHLAAVSVQPEVKPGVRHLLALRKLIGSQPVSCLFVEPQASLDIVSIIIEDFDVQVHQLDPMATDFPVTARGYVDFLQSTADKIASCL